MLDFMMENLSTILVGTAVAAMLALVAWKMLRDKKRGKSTCGCGGDCANCPSGGGACHPK